MGEQITISKEEYERLMSQAESQSKMFEALTAVKQELTAMRQQMDIFNAHFGRMYASQSIDETLLAMADLGKDEIGASECNVYSVDVFDNSKLFTADETGGRHYLTVEDGNEMKNAIDTHQPFIKDDGKDNLLIVPLEDQRNDVIGLVVAKGKEGGFTQEDIDAFNLKDGKIGNVFRMGLENKALQQKATTDNLTHLSNREGMNGFIKSEALPHIQHGEPVSVIILDIDHFKKFNDTYGHEVGDECLKQVADTLRTNVRQSQDSGVFRWGGEEMVVILPVDEHKAAEIANRLREAIENNPLLVNDKAVPITVSGGVAQFKTNLSYGIDKGNILDEFAKTFEQADAALYFSKENGRNQICEAAAIDSEIFKSVDLAQDIVASRNADNLFVSGSDQMIAYSAITTESYPDVIEALKNRAEASPYNSERIEQFNSLAEASDIVVNIVVDEKKGVYAELELKEFGNIVPAPLTSEEQETIKASLLEFMKENNITAPKFIHTEGVFVPAEEAPSNPVKDWEKILNEKYGADEPALFTPKEAKDIPQEDIDDAVYEATKDEIEAELGEMKEMQDKIFFAPNDVLLSDVDTEYDGDVPNERYERMITFKVGEFEGENLYADMYAGQDKGTGNNIVYNMDGDKAYLGNDRDRLFDMPSDLVKELESKSDDYITLAAKAEKEKDNKEID